MQHQKTIPECIFLLSTPRTFQHGNSETRNGKLNYLHGLDYRILSGLTSTLSLEETLAVACPIWRKGLQRLAQIAA